MSRLFREVGHAPLFPAGCVVAIGAFDGVHRGHRHLLALARARAQALALETVALSFEPLPREYFAAATPPARLTPPRSKFELLTAAGADAVGLLRFNAALAAMSATDFAERVLVRGLAVRAVCIGPDFRFGRARTGDADLLRELGAVQGCEVHVADELTDNTGGRVGASAIRAALAEGDFETAARALGRPYTIAGRVVRGERLGRQLGYPTANIPVRWRPAVDGILAVRVHGAGLHGWPGVASLGTRPTIAGGGATVLESHLFDFDGDLYGRRLEIEFVARLRDELRFDTLSDLVERMHEDARRARALLLPATATAAI